MVAIYEATAMPFFASVVKCFPATLDCVYNDIHCTSKTYFKPRVEISLEKIKL